MIRPGASKGQAGRWSFWAKDGDRWAWSGIGVCRPAMARPAWIRSSKPAGAGLGVVAVEDMEVLDSDRGDLGSSGLVADGDGGERGLPGGRSRSRGGAFPVLRETA